MTLSRRVRNPTGTKPRAAGVLSVALLLMAVSGCGTGFNPGAAATVDGSAISQDHVDSVVSAACAYTAASASGSTTGSPTSLANLRLTITQALIQFALTDKVTEAMHLDVTQASISINTQDTLPSGLGSADKAALTSFFADYAKSITQTQLIGEHLFDPSITSSNQVSSDKSSLAAKYLSTYAAKQDITVNPIDGRWNGSTVVGGSGSLSDPVSSNAKDALAATTSAQADTTNLLATQVC